MVAGSAASHLWMRFFHAKEATVIKVCEWLFGVPTLAPTGSNLDVVDPLIIALPIAIIATVIAQIISKKRIEEKHLAVCFHGVKTKAEQA